MKITLNSDEYKLMEDLFSESEVEYTKANRALMLDKLEAAFTQQLEEEINYMLTAAELEEDFR